MEINRVIDTVNQGTPAAASSPWPVRVSDGTNPLVGQKAAASSLPEVLASEHAVAAGSTLGTLPIGVAGSDDAGKARSVHVDPAGNLRYVSADMRSPFGEPVVVQITPITQQHWTYGINSRITKTFAKSGSSVAAASASGGGSDLVVSIDTTSNAYAIARSFRALHYRPGTGQVTRFTAAFNAGVANSRQFAGLWSAGSEYTVGYSGTTWGCFAKTGGTRSIYSLTVTTAATSANNATVTLDGTAVTVALTNQTGNPSRTAWEIASADYSAAGSAGSWGWDAYALGAVVYFVARRARTTAGSFTYAAGSTGSVATGPTQVRAGSPEVLSFGSPAVPGNFVFLDALDGTGPSGLNFDKQKSIIYEISCGHLGHRGADYFVMNPATRVPVHFARFNYMNTANVNALQNPTMYVAWGIEANGSNTAMTMYAGSGFGGLTGLIDPEEDGVNTWSVTSSKTATNGVANHYLSIQSGPILGLNNQTYRSSKAEVHIHNLSIGAVGGAGGTYVDVNVYRNATLTNLANFSRVDSTTLGLWAWQDTTTTTAVVSNGILIKSPRIPGQTGYLSIPVNWVLEPGETISVVITPSAANINVDVSLDGQEVQ